MKIKSQCWWILISHFFAIFGLCVGNKTLALSIYLDTPDPGETIQEDEIRVFNFKANYSLAIPSVRNESLLFVICVASEDQDVAEVYLSGSSRTFDLQKHPSAQFNFTVKGVFVGRTNFLFTYVFSHDPDDAFSCEKQTASKFKLTYSGNHFDLTYDPSDNLGPVWFSSRHEVVVVRENTPMDIAFNVVVVLLVIVVNLGLGCETKLHIIKETLRRPVAPAIGFGSQFIIMPLVSFGTVKLFKFDPAMAFGFFALGCSPGGSASNAYTWLLDGDLSLSITMTLISTLGALGMIPLWIFTLGSLLYTDSHITVPYQNIMYSLLGLVIPVSIGLLIQHKRPRWARVLVKVSKAMMGVFIVFVFTFGIYTKLYIFHLMSTQVILTGALMPYLGFFLGGLVAFACRMPRYRVLTIAIETGIQNTGIAIMLLLLSLDHPDSDLSITAPIIASILTPIPLLIVLAVKYGRQRLCKKHKLTLAEGDSDADPGTAGTVKMEHRRDGGTEGEMVDAVKPVHTNDDVRLDLMTNGETDHEENDTNVLLKGGSGTDTAL